MKGKIRIVQDGRLFLDEKTGEEVFESSILMPVQRRYHDARIQDWQVESARAAREEFEGWAERQCLKIEFRGENTMTEDTEQSFEDRLSELLGRVGARSEREGEYPILILSSDGTHEYTVSPRIEDDVRVWSCNCPAAKFGRACRHERLVVEAVNQAEEEFDVPPLWSS